MAYAAVAGAGGVLAGLGSCSGQPPRLTGTFLQLLHEHRTWSDAAWCALFSALAALGIRTLILQWSAIDSIRFYQPLRAGEPSAVHHLFRQAERLGMSIWTGLKYDNSWWSEQRRAAGDTRHFLRPLQAAAIETATELAPIIRGSPAFAGWYVTEEVDDISWAKATPALFDYLLAVSSALKRVDPDVQVTISGFTDSRSSPERVRKFWTALLTAAPPIDRLLFQDGVGAHKLGLEEVPEMFAAAAAAARARRCGFNPIIEIFEQTAGAPLDTEAFAAIAGPWQRVARQLDAAGRFSSEVIAFSVPEYMIGNGAGGAPALRTSYQHYVQRFS